MSLALKKQQNYSDEQIADLQKRVLDYKETTGLSWDQIFRKTAIAKSTIQSFAQGTYKGVMDNIAVDIERWFKNNEALDLFLTDEDWAPTHQPTRTSREIKALLTHAKRGEMVAIIGDPGVGKSDSLSDFTKGMNNVWMITLSPSCGTHNAVLLEILSAFNIPPGKRNTYQLSLTVRQQFAKREKCLLIIDEAQHASEKALEELRAIHDLTKVGIACVGNREVTRNLEGNMQASFAQRSSRLSMKHVFAVPYPEDVRIILDAWNVEDEHERKLLTEIAVKPNGGAIRQMSKVLKLANILAKDMDNNAERSIKHIRSAMAQLGSGAMA